MAAALLAAMPAGSQPTSLRTDDCAQVYRVSRATAPLPRIDGTLSEGEWPESGWESGLLFPWRESAAPGTAFNVVSGGDDLFFAFRVTDHDVVVADGDAEDESLVERGDRVELFFARDPQLDEYYSIEVDPGGRVLDYRGRFYRRFDRDWDCHGLEAAATRQADGYVVEGRLPGAALQAMGLAAPTGGSLLVAGVFRAEFSHRSDGPPDESWISWVRPRVEEPDFHVPSAFGCFQAPVDD